MAFSDVVCWAWGKGDGVIGLRYFWRRGGEEVFRATSEVAVNVLG